MAWNLETKNEYKFNFMMNENDFEILEEMIWRWKNHYKMLSIIINSGSDISKDQFDIWRNQIDSCFAEKIKSKL